MRAKILLGLVLTLNLTHVWAEQNTKSDTAQQNDVTVQSSNSNNANTSEIDATSDTFDDSDFDDAPSK